nr:helix-turn-helix domain-containing protein [Paenibacillus sp. R14(2021)]
MEDDTVNKKYNVTVEATLDVIGGKWKPLILCYLTKSRKRQCDFLQHIPNLTQKMLTQQLRELVQDGIVNRISYNQMPPKVEYELTEYGQSLQKVLDAMCDWGEQHINKLYENKFDVLEENVFNQP